MILGQRTRKKHKKLDAICEDVFNESRRLKNEFNGGTSVGKDVGNESELRRSSRARRAPVILDASPTQSRKRRRFGGLRRENGGGLRGKGKVENVSGGLGSGDLDEELSTWKSRLRTRGRSVSYKHLNEGVNQQLRKRKVFGVEEEESEDNVACLKGEGSRVVKSKKLERARLSIKHEDEGEDASDDDQSESEVGKSKKPVRAGLSNKYVDMDEHEDDSDEDQSESEVGKSENPEKAGSSSEHEDEDDDEDEDEDENENDLDEDQSESEKSETDAEVSVKEDDGNHSLSTTGENDGDEEIVDGSTVHAVYKEEGPAYILVKEENVNDNVKDVGQDDQIVSTSEPVEEENQRPSMEASALDNDGVEDERDDIIHEGSMDKTVVTHAEHGNEQMENQNVNRVAASGPRIKEGRRCGLCGCRTDGKPPKRLDNDSNGSDHETYSGSSASEEIKYDPWDGFDDEPGWLGKLLGPINDRYGIAGIWVHQHCAVWSPEVYFAGVGCLKNVRAALCRGRALKCTRCGRPGATLGCRVDRCPRTYHLPCARASDCHFDHRKFLIACADHRHLFQPHGHQYLQRIKKLKARKMKLEIKKLSNDASRRDIEAEEKWMEKCGEDEEFLRREAKRLQRDLVRIAPVYIGGSHSEGQNLSEGWESVAGLQDVIRCMKEVVIMPLLYPEFFDNMGITPPRGVLLHGYPGTGKTLVVRALIGACARGDRRIAYFARKGADCLGKYVGDAERQLRLLFQVAERSQPSIIFFDEIDGLAPVRTRQQDQTHSSVVSTLLALMDGLKSRGSVVVIGATNRPDAVDPALRRPGRFDREIYFPLPSLKDRAAILSLHTKKWPKPVAGPLLEWVASKTVGFAGADLQALCAQVAVIALKRNCSWQQVLSCSESNLLNGKRPQLPTFSVEERDWLEALSLAPPPCSRREAGMAANEVLGSPLHLHLILCLLQPLLSLIISLYLDDRIWLPPRLYHAGDSVKRTLVSAMEKKSLQTDRWWVLVPRMVQESDIARAVVRDLYFAGIVDGSAAFTGNNSGNCGSFSESRSHPSYGDVNPSGFLKNLCHTQLKKEGYRILIAGDPRSGQKHLASCLIHCFVGSIEMQKIDLATISQEGQGDVEEGISRILLKCAGMKLCAVFMPRIDLWAIQNVHKDIEASPNDESCEENSLNLSQLGSEECSSQLYEPESMDVAEPQAELWTASRAWNSFVEQLECICVSSSLIILATSELPYAALPNKICQFFGVDSSKSEGSFISEHVSPRFSVELDGKFDQELLMDSSASELSRESIQQFIHLVHRGNHVLEHSSIVSKPHSKAENGTSNHMTGLKSVFENHGNGLKSVDENHGTHLKSVDESHETRLESLDENHETNLKSVDENHETRVKSVDESHGADLKSLDAERCVNQLPDVSATTISYPSGSRQGKEKSNLVLAISTFGYQILRYPHFSELCWVTSKLKEGPSADISGPWKGWPFNSCIVRPCKSMPKENVAWASNNSKGKDRFTLVRGLVAIGLSAYKGIYTSPSEVSLEVRKVLQLLVKQISDRIQSGKDRYQYFRLLSQVAYLEDMVDNWAHSLRSLEPDSQTKSMNTKLAGLQSLESCQTPSHKVPQLKEYPSTRDNLQEVALVKDGLHRSIAENPVPANSNPNAGEGEDATDPPNLGINSHEKMASSTHDDTPMADQSCVSTSIHTNSEEHGASLFHTLEKSPVVAEEMQSTQPSSQSVCENARDLSNVENGMGTKLPAESGKHLVDSDTPMPDINSSSVFSDLSLESNSLCSYTICDRCISTLYQFSKKIVSRDWQLSGSCSTLEDAHDLVSSLSTSFCSIVRDLFSENRSEGCRKLFESPKRNDCQCSSSDNQLTKLKDCVCHNGEEVNMSSFDPGFTTTYMFRDGVLISVDSGQESPFHCKYDKLCLCSLIELIVTSKQPLE